MSLLPYTAGRVFNAPLMITHSKLDTILNVLAPRMQGELLPIALPQDEREYETTSAGIAVIPVIGTLVRRTVGLEAQSGLTSYMALEDRLDAALNDNTIRGILLDIDSPGGESGGVFDLADKIRAARKIKPIWAVVNEDAFSAAYVIASAAEQIYIPRTGGVGSIGVIAVHLDESKAEEDAGLTYTAVYAGARKNDLSPHEPLSDPARVQLQAEVNRIYKILTGTVARMRGIDQARIESTEAALYFGENALAVGFADKIGTFGDALQALAHRVIAPAFAGGTEVPPPTTDEENMTASLEKPDEQQDEKETKSARRRRLEQQDDDENKEKSSRRRAEAEEDDDEEEKSARRLEENGDDDDENEEETQLEEEGEDEDEEEADTPPSSRGTKRAKRKATKRSAGKKGALAYISAVNELCLLAGRPDKAAIFISKAVPLPAVRKALLNARAAQDDASVIMGHAPHASSKDREPTIDTAAIYAQRNKQR